MNSSWCLLLLVPSMLCAQETAWSPAKVASKDPVIIGRSLDIYEAGLHTGRAGFAVDVTDLEEARKELNRHIRAHASTLTS